ncbi:MAG: hypothetical protein IH948_01490 [Bacteroidetes bacterium]|nr:hypothetical protein [Bacteroidota bacterium]
MKNTSLTILLLLIQFQVSAQTWQALPNSPLMQPIANGYQNHDDIEFCNDSVGWICDISGHIFKTTDGGDSWVEQMNQFGTSFRSLAFINCDTGYVGNLGPGDWVKKTSDPTLMYKTYDGGANWTPVTTIPTVHNPQGVCGMQAIDAQNIVAVGRYDDPAIFYKSTDGGATWITKDIGADNGVKGLVDLHFFNPDTGLITGRMNGSGIWYTTDGGQNFTQVASAYKDHVWKIFFLDRMHGYANISNYDKGDQIYLYTSDGGVTWTERVYRSEGNQYEGLGIGFFSEQVGWCAGDDVTYETTDGGVTFNPISIDPDYKDVINRFYRASDSVMYAIGSRVYKYTDLTIGARTVPYVDNSLCKISCNPNPISGPAQITYTVPEDGDVFMAVTSIGGRAVEVLVDKKQKAGTYTIPYNPDYKLKFVSCTIGVGRYRCSVHILRED